MMKLGGSPDPVLPSMEKFQITCIQFLGSNFVLSNTDFCINFIILQEHVIRVSRLGSGNKLGSWSFSLQLICGLVPSCNIIDTLIITGLAFLDFLKKLISPLLFIHFTRQKYPHTSSYILVRQTCRDQGHQPLLQILQDKVYFFAFCCILGLLKKDLLFLVL